MTNTRKSDFTLKYRKKKCFKKITPGSKNMLFKWLHKYSDKAPAIKCKTAGLLWLWLAWIRGLTAE